MPYIKLEPKENLGVVRNATDYGPEYVLVEQHPVNGCPNGCIRHPIQVDPSGCGCTECLVGCYINEQSVDIFIM